MKTPSFYAPAPEPARADDALTAYLSFLERRNGPGFAARDRRMAEQFDPGRVHAELKVDSARFNRNYVSLTQPDVPLEELALLAFVKINAGEAYGVEVVSAARAKQQQGPELAARVERVLTQEERYHTRLLVDASRHFEGLEVRGAWRPAWSLRLLIGSLARLPSTLFHPLLLASEIAGVHAFDWLLRRLRTLFPHEPRVRESMEARLIEVLTDEVGHVAFNRVMVGAVGRAVARPLARLVTLGHQVTGKELLALGYGSEALGRLERFDYADLPAEVRRNAFFV